MVTIQVSILDQEFGERPLLITKRIVDSDFYTF